MCSPKTIAVTLMGGEEGRNPSHLSYHMTDWRPASPARIYLLEDACLAVGHCAGR